MRTWFWTLLVFVLAVGLALVLRDHSGNVLIIAQPWRIELSLTLAVLLVLGCFVIGYIALRALSWLVSGPERFRSWRTLRVQKRDHELLENGWISVLEGRYSEAEKGLSRLLTQTHSDSRKVLAALALARASHHMGEFARRDEALQLARDSAGNQPRLKEAAGTVAAEMYLEQGRADEARLLLEPLQDASSRYFNATRLLLQAHRQLKNHDRVYELTRLLLRRGVIDKPQALQLIETSAAARLHAGGAKSYKALWGDLKADERVLPEIALAAAAVQESIGDFDEVSRILEAAINAGLEPRLLSAYSQCPPEQVARRLSKAEVWLRAHPNDSGLLAALGNLCLIGQIWGQGERYLLRSKKIRSDVRIHALLGNLYDRLGRQADAITHWRLASGVAGVLPVLPLSRALPAADTRGDPTLIEVETIPESDFSRAAAADAASADAASADAAAADAGAAGAAGATPDAASATDSTDLIADEADTRASDPSALPSGSATSATTLAESGLDEYFDSAPIPGVDLSQTSDRPYDSSDRR